MSSKVKDIRIRNHRIYFFDDVINTKYFNPNNIEIVEKSYKNILIYYIEYITIEDLKFVKNNRVNPLYLFQQSE